MEEEPRSCRIKREILPLFVLRVNRRGLTPRPVSIEVGRNSGRPCQPASTAAAGAIVLLPPEVDTDLYLHPERHPMRGRPTEITRSPRASADPSPTTRGGG